MMKKKATRALSLNNFGKIANLKRSQITLWIIMAVVIAAAIVLFFVLRGKISIPGITPSMPNPQEYIEKCVKDATLEAVSIMLPQAGFISPDNYKMYEDDKVAYLCYNKNYYQACINQMPLYIDFLENEIKSYIDGKLKDCFYNLKQEYQDRNYVVNEGDLSLNVNLNPKQAEVEIDKKFEISKGEETRRYEKFKAKINSPIYDLAVIAQEIVNQEAKFCYFEYLGFSLLYPLYSIEKTDINGEVKIYEVKEKLSGKQLIFAVRSCALPAGM